jgi:hypothetical protein
MKEIETAVSNIMEYIKCKTNTLWEKDIEHIKGYILDVLALLYLQGKIAGKEEFLEKLNTQKEG